MKKPVTSKAIARFELKRYDSLKASAHTAYAQFSDTTKDRKVRARASEKYARLEREAAKALKALREAIDCIPEKRRMTDEEIDAFVLSVCRRAQPNPVALAVQDAIMDTLRSV